MALKLVSGYPLVNSMTPAELQAEVVKLRAALRQVIEDCEVAGNLSYAARTARDALGAKT